MAGGENTDHYVAILIFKYPDVIAYIRQKISRLMRHAKPGHVFQQPAAIDLTAHDLKHLIARLLAYRFALRDLFEQLSHVPWRRQSKRRFALHVKLQSAGRGLYSLKPYVRRARRLDCVEAVALHELINRLSSAYLFIKQVGSCIIAYDDHQGDQIFNIQARACVERANNPRPR